MDDVLDALRAGLPLVFFLLLLQARAPYAQRVCTACAARVRRMRSASAPHAQRICTACAARVRRMRSACAPCACAPHARSLPAAAEGLLVRPYADSTMPIAPCILEY